MGQAVLRVERERVAQAGRGGWKAFAPTGRSAWSWASCRRVAPNWFSDALLRFEIKIRASAILGFVGAAGIALRIAQRHHLRPGPLRRGRRAMFILLFLTIVVVDPDFQLHPQSVDPRGEPMTMTAAADTADLRAAAASGFALKRLVSIGIQITIPASLSTSSFSSTSRGWSRTPISTMPRALVADTVGHKIHVERDNRTGDLEVAIEGERRGVFPAERVPDWIAVGETTRHRSGRPATRSATCPTGRWSTTFPVSAPSPALPPPRADGVQVTWPDSLDPEDLPDWISVSRNNLRILTEEGRLTVTPQPHRGFSLFLRLGDVLVHGRQPLFQPSLPARCCPGPQPARPVRSRRNSGTTAPGTTAWCSAPSPRPS